MRVLVVAGTRPEAIKLAPVVSELRRKLTTGDVLLCATGQHREMFDQVLGLFGLKPDIDLAVMTHNQSLSELTAAVLSKVTGVLTELKPDWVVVQGDTTTAMTAALAGFYCRTQVAHVEAGLRTGDKSQPFPEEVNRRVIDTVSDWLFAPTMGAAANLTAEGFDSRRILVTGNTGIDALVQIAQLPPTVLARDLLAGLDGRRLVLVTSHRRENFGQPLEHICDALLKVAGAYPDVSFILPVHPNPNVKARVTARLEGHPSFKLTTPLDYRDFVTVMGRAHLILSDSGGVQEEAPSLGKPVLVLRETTERPEAVECGTARLVGTNAETVYRETARLLDSPEAYRDMAQRANPFGDGHASERIVDALLL